MNDWYIWIVYGGAIVVLAMLLGALGNRPPREMNIIVHFGTLA